MSETENITVEEALETRWWNCYTKGHKTRYEILAKEVESLRTELVEKERKLLAREKVVEALREAGEYMRSEISSYVRHSQKGISGQTMPGGTVGQNKWHKALTKISDLQ